MNPMTQRIIGTVQQKRPSWPVWVFKLCIAGMLGLGLACSYLEDTTGTSPTEPEPTPGQELIFDNGNVYAVRNAPNADTTFSIDTSFRIVVITNYHWNDGTGSPGGTIGLRKATGEEFGPWPVTTREGQGGVPNAYWDASPNTVIGAGTYTVLDSEPSTWAQNDQSGGQGMSRIEGIRQ